MTIEPRSSPYQRRQIKHLATDGVLAKDRSGHGSLVDVELLAQGQVLEGELAVAANEEGEEPKQPEHERDHRALIVLGS